MPARNPLPWLAVVLVGAAAAGCQTTISSTVKGSKTPTTAICEPGQPNRIANGGFTIAQDCVFSENTVIGDGRDEVTLWEFDFSDEEDYAGCFPETAVMELRLRPEGNLLNETLRVEGKWELGLEEIQSLEVGIDQSTTIDMMLRNGRPSPYTPWEIQKLLTGKPAGRIPMVYEQNAVLSYARLDIRCAN
jgi:hypothetical protein